MDPLLRSACLRAVAAVDLRARRGLDSVACIATAAPLLGFLGTIVNIPACFPGFGTERWTAFSIVTGRLSTSIAPSALGLLAGIVAHWIHAYLRNRADAMLEESRVFFRTL